MIENSIQKPKKFFKLASKEIYIKDERQQVLLEIVHQIVSQHNMNKKVRLNFICTHNSRRSQLAQVWAHFAIQYFKLKRIKSYSGGTEVTAMHPNTVKTLQTVGFHFKLLKFNHENPVYEVSFKNMRKSIVAFSKLYDDVSNNKPFIAITTCSSANENCPFIPNALARIHVPYIDPKISDNTPKMNATYLETNKQIAAEMYFVFQQVQNLL